jgi:uncharacterized protein with HEPN domain
VTEPRDYLDFVRDMIEACRSTIRFVEGMNLDDYLADEKTRFAVMRGYEIMGEAVRHLPGEIMRTHPDIPWNLMVAVRNRSIHGYFGIDDTILFTTIREDLGALLQQLERLGEELGLGEPPYPV